MVAARLITLVLAVVGFAAAWSLDGRPDAAPPILARRDPRRTPIPAAPVRLAAQTVAETPREVVAPVDEAADLPVPLQAGMTPGRYVYADAAGRTQHITITAAALSAAGLDPDVRPQSHYSGATSGRTWCLVRIDQPAIAGDLPQTAVR